jgi:hypothetical protein
VVHGLLHVPTNIRYCAPSWATWTFHVERGCGDFQRALRSKSAPATNLDKHVLYAAYLDQLENRFDLGDELSEVGKRPKGVLTRNEKIIEGCKCSFADLVFSA